MIAREQGLDDVGRVEAPAQADLEHGDAHAGFAEEIEGDGRGALEEGRRRLERPGLLQRLDRSAHAVDGPAQSASVSTSSSSMTNRSSRRSRCGEV